MRKDDKLVEIYKNGGNVAQFISIDSSNPKYPKDIFIRSFGGDETDLKGAILELIDKSFSKSVNVRSYAKGSMKGNSFIYGKKKEEIDEILEIIQENTENGLESLINETIDVSDGGVSGVLVGDIIEFSPNDTPRCVEKEGVCSLERKMGIDMLESVYNLNLSALRNKDRNLRVEFSIHPMKQGVRQTHIIFWEEEEIGDHNFTNRLIFPNNFSEHIGDKVFGLLLADFGGANVPFSTVISRNVAPFMLGIGTGCSENWIRTAPFKKQGGLFETVRGWRDPFKMMEKNERLGKGSDIDEVGALIVQSSVDAFCSGAGILTKDQIIVEGVTGFGDDFMQGAESEELPRDVIERVKKEMSFLRDRENWVKKYGDLSFEWIVDENGYVWIVQVNQFKHKSNKKDFFVETDEEIEYVDFITKDNSLNDLRELISTVGQQRKGIRVIGNIGLTSHIGDVLRASNTPSYLVREKK